jgi:hypothetical protein
VLALGRDERLQLVAGVQIDGELTYPAALAPARGRDPGAEPREHVAWVPVRGGGGR